MRASRFGLAVVLVFVAGSSCFAQQQDPNAQPQQRQQVQALAEKQLQEAQRQIRENPPGRGRCRA